MPRFAANLTYLFTEVPFIERFAAARRAGFKAAEFMFPYDFNQEEIKAQLRETGLQLILCNLPAGNWAGGDRGTAANPERKEEFREGIAKGIDAARTLDVDRLNCLVGLKNQALSDEETWQTLRENIRYAAESLQKERIRLMVEPLNHLDVPGFALNTCSQVLKLLRESAHPNAYLQFDIYQARREDEDATAILRNHLDRIGISRSPTARGATSQAPEGPTLNLCWRKSTAWAIKGLFRWSIFPRRTRKARLRGFPHTDIPCEVRPEGLGFPVRDFLCALVPPCREGFAGRDPIDFYTERSEKGSEK
jgi:hydroxypyruvate isomerase